MKLINALACVVGFHVRPSGINPVLSVFWECAHCHELVPGALHRRRAAR